MKFIEGQQVWVCANLGGQIIRQKGVVLAVSETEVFAGSFSERASVMSRYAFDIEGKSENLWLEERLSLQDSTLCYRS